jgi:hypothetical protein
MKHEEQEDFLKGLIFAIGCAVLGVLLGFIVVRWMI